MLNNNNLNMIKKAKTKIAHNEIAVSDSEIQFPWFTMCIALNTL